MKLNMDKFKELVKEEPIGLQKPLKLLYSYGCTANELSVNGISEIDLTDAQRNVVIHRIMNWYKKHPEELNSLLADFVERYGDCEIGSYCEQCHDIPYIYEMEI